MYNIKNKYKTYNIKKSHVSKEFHSTEFLSAYLFILVHTCSQLTHKLN